MTEPSLRAILFDLDDTLNDRAASWRAFVDQMRHAKPPVLTGEAEEIFEQIRTEDRGGYRPKDELFAALVTLPWRSPQTA